MTAAGLSVEVARFTGDQPAQAAWLARLGDLYQAQQQHADALACWQASAELAHRLGDQALVVALQATVGQASEPPAMGTWQMARQTLEQAVQRIRWLSPLWEPVWAGVPLTGADTAALEQVVALPTGSLHLTCRWFAASPTQPATLLLAWTADAPNPGDLWVRFTQRDNPTVVLAEQLLGDAHTGEAEWSADELGFDPSNEPWALTLMLMEPPA